VSTNSLTPIEPTNAALLVMDYQNGLFERVEGGDALPRRTATSSCAKPGSDRSARPTSTTSSKREGSTP
jgi:nicotinamidase-related amidase